MFACESRRSLKLQ